MRKFSVTFLAAALVVAAATALAAFGEDPIGVSISTTDSDCRPQIVYDGAGGYFATWQVTSGAVGVYAKHYDNNGDMTWDATLTISNYADSSAMQESASDGKGGLLVAFEDYDGYTRVQRVRRDGTAVWEEGGVVVLDAYDGWVAADGTGGAIVMSYESGEVNRVAADGSLPWANAKSFSSSLSATKIAPSAGGGAVMLWYDYNLSAIVVQKVDNDGNFVWNDGDPVELSSSGSCPRIATYGGDTFVVWYNVDAVMVQKIDADGNVMWGAGGLVASEMAYPNDEEIAADGNGGAYVTWATDGVPYAQYIDSEGNIAWESDLALTTQTDFSGTPQHPRHTSEDGEGGFVTTWYTSDDVIKAQRVDSMGALLWSDAGADVAMGESISYGPKITSNGQGSAVAIWVDNRYDAGSDSSSYDVMMQGISGEGVAGKPDYTPSSSSSSGCFITTLGMEN